jgi:8-oxo-dGTP pyrophosphatase MutT (NUDIX family)
MGEILRQAAAIAYRVRKGKIQVLLVTSRDQGRWIIPKGHIDPGTTPIQTAVTEAHEEAGIEGIVNKIPLGLYTYFKRLEAERSRPATVEVYLMHVTRQREAWPEKGQRKLAWMSIKKAVQLIQEPGIIPLLKRLMELEANLVLDDNPAQKQPYSP